MHEAAPAPILTPPHASAPCAHHATGTRAACAHAPSCAHACAHACSRACSHACARARTCARALRPHRLRPTPLLRPLRPRPRPMRPPHPRQPRPRLRLLPPCRLSLSLRPSCRLRPRPRLRPRRPCSSPPPALAPAAPAPMPNAPIFAHMPASTSASGPAPAAVDPLQHVVSRNRRRARRAT